MKIRSGALTFPTNVLPGMCTHLRAGTPPAALLEMAKHRQPPKGLWVAVHLHK